jgi:hypothetical protein
LENINSRKIEGNLRKYIAVTTVAYVAIVVTHTKHVVYYHLDSILLPEKTIGGWKTTKLISHIWVTFILIKKGKQYLRNVKRLYIFVSSHFLKFSKNHFNTSSGIFAGTVIII